MGSINRLPPLPVRFFCYDQIKDGLLGVVEISEDDFRTLINKGVHVDYVRHTVRENGASQICLTAMGEMD